MAAKDATQWFWSDWSGDKAVRRLSPAERGVWIDLLAYAAVGKPVGYVCDDNGLPISYEEIARFTNATPTEVEALIKGIVDKGAASRDRTGRLFNRRMVRQAELSAKRKKIGKDGGEATKLKWQALQHLVGQNARHGPRKLAGIVDPLPIQLSKTTTSSDDAAREGSAGKGEIVPSPELLANVRQWGRGR